MQDTIFAPITIRGKSAVCVVRISGNEVLNILKKLSIKRELSHRMATLCKIKDLEGNFLDEALVVYFKAPNSFTGEDVCEISLHSSKYIVNKLFEILSKMENTRFAEPGEFSKRAFLNGKLDLMQAEAIIDLIDSETELQHKQAMKQLTGDLSSFYKDLRVSIVEVLSIIEAFIDFPEENIPDDLIDEINKKIKNIIATIENELENGNNGEKIRDGINIAIVGRPNVGKSSLLNYLAKKDVAIVSEYEGTTRDLVEFSMDITGIPAIIYDTAGIRETNDFIECEGIKRAMKAANYADVKVILLSPDNIEIEENIKDLIDKNTIIVLNKVDLVKNLEELKQKIKEKNENNDVIPISVKNNINLDILNKKIEEIVSQIVSPNTQSHITRERHRVELEKALFSLKNFSNDNPIEINAEEIRNASNSIGKITGIITTDEVLDNIFSKFCIGK